MTTVLHLFFSLPEKYGSDFARLMSLGSAQYEHVYVAFTEGADALTHPFPGSYSSLSGSRSKRIRSLDRIIGAVRPEAIVLHSFMYDWRTALLLLGSDLLHHWSTRALWSIWGADLYYGDERVRAIPFHRRYVGRTSRHLFTRRIRHLTAFATGDSLLARQRWSPRARVHGAFYPFALEGPISPVRACPSLHTIQVGNSGDPSNRHEELLHELAGFSSSIRVVCPLAYGGTGEYRDRVASTGSRLFGERFLALRTMSSRRDYQNVVAGMDSGIFGHRRQQALWNILLHLYLGNRVFLHENTTHLEFLRNRGFAVDSLASVHEYYASQPGPREADRPVCGHVLEQFGDEASLRAWEEAFVQIADQSGLGAF